MADGWRTHLHELEALARAEGLDYLPVDFEAVPDSLMMEIAIYGLPVRMPHWSFGVRYIYRLVQHRLGLSRLFEVVFPGNPGHAYLGRNNSDAENLLVVAHVLGHADFSANNLLFRRSAAQVGEHIVEQAATHARQIAAAIEAHGADRVETVLDAALALEQHVDVDAPLRRPPYPTEVLRPAAPAADPFLQRFRALGPDVSAPARDPRPVTRAPVPPHPERDLLWFIAHHAPELEPWERDIFLAVREESFYFYPVFACQTMNEGWASYWHARLLREAKFLPQGVYVDAIKCHSDVVRPTASGDGVSLHINPYHLGFHLWDRIIERDGVEAARLIMQQDDDFAFIRGQLDAEVAA
ncbi:MAG TPA: SpoVR family protein, partial [Steroidobacteraceae bacterium]|nr:SpoVR family protein [Steroidobacteraceae bacterium]